MQLIRSSYILCYVCGPVRVGGEPMPIRSRRWNDAHKDDDGMRILVCRYRPHAVPRESEPWHLWCQGLGPSKELHADYYGKTGNSITWEDYRQRYLEEMKGQTENIRFLAEKVAAGETITLLCSSACEDASKCHRSLLRGLIDDQV